MECKDGVGSGSNAFAVGCGSPGGGLITFPVVLLRLLV